MNWFEWQLGNIYDAENDEDRQQHQQLILAHVRRGTCESKTRKTTFCFTCDVLHNQPVVCLLITIHSGRSLPQLHARFAKCFETIWRVDRVSDISRMSCVGRSRFEAKSFLKILRKTRQRVLIFSWDARAGLNPSHCKTN
jgi:hypothetical protein